MTSKNYRLGREDKII